MTNVDFLSGPVIKNLSSSAGDTGSIPGLERFHMPQGNQAHVPQLLNPSGLEQVLHNKRSHHSKKPQLESSPHLSQLEKARTQQQRPSIAKHKQINKI